MSTDQLKKLQELSQVFSQGKANPKQIQQLSELLSQINSYNDGANTEDSEDISFIAAPRFG